MCTVIYSIHPFSTSGAYPSCHWAGGRVHPAQVTTQSQGHIETKETNNHPQSYTYSYGWFRVTQKGHSRDSNPLAVKRRCEPPHRAVLLYTSTSLNNCTSRPTSFFQNRADNVMLAHWERHMAFKVALRVRCWRPILSTQLPQYLKTTTTNILRIWCTLSSLPKLLVLLQNAKNKTLTYYFSDTLPSSEVQALRVGTDPSLCSSFLASPALNWTKLLKQSNKTQSLTNTC